MLRSGSLADRGLDCSLFGAVTAVFAMAVLACGLAPGARAACPPAPGETAAVTAIVDGTTLALDDGSELRLAGISAPSARDTGAASAVWAPEQAARAHLSTLIETRIIALAAGSDIRDRYRRRVAAALLPSRDGAPPLWIERALVEMGHARVAPVPGETACFGALLEAEALARSLRLGLWANPAYAVRTATNRTALRARIGTLQLVEGRVQRVSMRRTHIYLEFGEDWRRDTTAVIARRLLQGPDGKERTLTHLEGRRVRVRGWIEMRYGPSLDLAAFEAIEVLRE